MSLTKTLKRAAKAGIRQPIRWARITLYPSKDNPVQRAMKWFHANRIPGSGIRPFPGNPTATQEVTGYSIPTLYSLGEKDMARDLAMWEAGVQRSDGAVCALDGVPYTFDTAQVIRGFLAVVDDLPELEDNLRRACDYVDGMIAPDGEVRHESYEIWKFKDGGMLSKYGNLYVLPPMQMAGEKLGERRYVQAAKRGMEYFRAKPDLMEFKPDMSTTSHYLGYMTEALVDLGEPELAAKGLRQAEAIQKENGAIPAYPGVDWVCSTGIAQLSIAWYKIGDPAPADRAMAYLEKLQNPSGGFFGSYGPGAAYFPNQEIAWATKFFLDAYQLKIQADFNRERGLYGETIHNDDGRIREIMSFFGDLSSKRVLDVGCGTGRYLRVMREKWPDAELHGLDLSEEMLRSCPPGVQTRLASLLCIPYPNDSFDFVYCVETLEHALLVENSIREMVRVLKPGGKLIIIDKNIALKGSLEIKPWELWFKPRRLSAILERHGLQVSDKPISYDGIKRPTGLFIAWEGIKSA